MYELINKTYFQGIKGKFFLKVCKTFNQWMLRKAKESNPEKSFNLFSQSLFTYQKKYYLNESTEYLWNYIKTLFSTESNNI